MGMSAIYNTDFFAKVAKGMRDSAHEVVPVLYDMLKPESVVDVGCGEGWWLREFAELGVKRLVGVEQNVDCIAAGEHVKYDLSTPLRMNERFDLCLCLEVAEHLAPESADTLIDTLCGLSGTVVFSAAIPRQGGNGHLNEQWQRYWFGKFEARGYGLNLGLRNVFWNNLDIEVWYIQNMMVFSKGLHQNYYHPIDVIHPRLWEIYRGR